jgi:hypothetical protein
MKLEGKKRHLFIFNGLKVKYSISFHYMCKQQMTVALQTLQLCFQENHRDFHLTLQLLTIN